MSRILVVSVVFHFLLLGVVLLLKFDPIVLPVRADTDKFHKIIFKENEAKHAPPVSEKKLEPDPAPPVQENKQREDPIPPVEKEQEKREEKPPPVPDPVPDEPTPTVKEDKPKPPPPPIVNPPKDNRRRITPPPPPIIDPPVLDTKPEREKVVKEGMQSAELTPGLQVPKYYLKNCWKLLQQNFYQQKHEAGRSVIVQFEILKDGTIRSVKIVKSSGRSTMDKIALQTLEMTVKLPALPEGINRPHIKASVTFKFD